MKYDNTILFIGPVPPPTTGQSFAFQQVYENYKGSKRLVNLNYTEVSTIQKVLTLLKCLIQIFFIATTDKKVKLSYFSCAVTKDGNVRDIVIINILALFNIKIVNHIHGSGFDNLIKSLSGLHQRLAIKAFQKVDTSIVLMEAMRKEFELFKETMNIRVVENFYDPLIDKYATNHKENTDEINIIYFSNLMYTKGIAFLLQAFESLTTKYPNLRLHIAGHILGDGEITKEKMKDILNGYLAKYDTIQYHGLVKGEEKAKFLFKGDIFVLPTFYFREAFPISIIEAMRCGNAIITTRHNYLEYIVNEDQGKLIPIKSADAIEDAVVLYLKNADLLLSHQNYNTNFAKSNYTLEKYISKVLAIFESTLEDSVVNS